VSIRWRLTLAFASVFAVAAFVAALFFYAAFQNWVVSQNIDGQLRVFSEVLVATLPSENGSDIDYNVVASAVSSSGDSASTVDDIYVQLMNSDRSVVARSQNLGDQELPFTNKQIDNGFDGTATIATVSSGGTSFRTFVRPVKTNEGTCFLEVAQSLAVINPNLSRMLLALVLVVVVFVTLATASVAIMIGRALSPVKRITATAQSITSSGDLSRRVKYRGAKDEIGRLAATFDQMIGQLDQLMRSQRTFVADASHELRGPLTVIRGNLDLLKRNLSEEDRSESIRVLEAEMTRMTRIINDLLVLAEVESGPLEEQQMVSLKDLLLDAQDRALLLAGNRRIVVGRQDDLWVKGDGHKLDQMINNLVSNAVKYTPDGGTITLSLSQEGDWARFEVTDTGIGISPEHLPHLFDRFYRVDKARSRAGGGTGLGLAIVKGIAEQHGGRVAVTSEPGKGSTFTVWLKL